MAVYPVYTDEPINGNIILSSNRYMVESVSDGMVAAGATQASATPITNEVSRFTNVPLGTGASLPRAKPGVTVYVINHGLNSLQVYGALYGDFGQPITNEIINDKTSTIGVSQMVNSTVLYICTTSGIWYTEGLATGFAGGLQTLTFATILNNATNTQASGTLITTQIVTINNTSNPGSVTLPPAIPGLQITVRNTLATNVTNVYPSAGGTGSETINGGAVNAPYVITGAVGTTFICSIAGAWLTVPVVPA